MAKLIFFRKRTTTREQFKGLISRMKEHPDIAKNFTRSAPNEVEQFWESVREELNSLGPPSKSISEWKKVWSDFKSAVKKKLAHNKRELQATGGGENRELPLSSLEEDVAALVGLNACVGGIKNSKEFGVPQRRIIEHATPLNSEQVVEDITPSTSKRARTNSYTSRDAICIELLENEDMENNQNTRNELRKKKRPEQFDLLDKQIGVQERLYSKVSEGVGAQELHFKNVKKELKDLTRSVDRLGDHQKKTNEILQAFLEETKRHNMAMETNAIEKLRVKQELLSIELGEVNKQLRLKK
ncbi:uncharacterized protein LOC129239489 [Anastrepha obliqua]|uniref:uncharacterized protein LOC129239489 n=1 Tax=Anastrepha obliqua TaxID=95512 RepID=UPI00240A50B4|nr:uncharacterized protein LOC129239489 [Anastrepha obliqua]